MNNDENGGSGSGTGGSVAAGAAAGSDGAKNKTAKMSMDQALARVDELERQHKADEKTIGELTQQLKEANDVLEGQEKAKLIGEIMPRSTFKLDELAGKSIEDLKNIRATLDQAMPPKVNSARFAVQAGDLSDREKNLSIGDISVATALKRKRMKGE